MAKVFYRKKFSDYLGEQRAIDDVVVRYESDTVPTPTPTPVPVTPTPSPSSSPIPPTPTPTLTKTPTGTPSVSATPTLTPTPTKTPAPGCDITYTELPSPTPSNTPTYTPTPTNTPTASPGPSFDPDAAAYLSAVVSAGGTTSPTISAATNTLFTQLKGAGLYSKIPYFYPMIGATAASNAIMGNRTFGTTYDLTYNGTITHSTSGITKTSDINTADWCDTNIIPSSSLLTLTSIHISSYMNILGAECCGYHGAGPAPYIALRQPYRQIILGGASTDGGYVTEGCFSIGSRTASNITKSFDRTATTPFTQYGGTQTGAQNSLPSNSIGIFHINGISGFYANGTIAFFTIGLGLTDGECANLDTIINTFNTTLGRNF